MTYIVHIVARRKDDPYKHIHIDEEVNVSENIHEPMSNEQRAYLFCVYGIEDRNLSFPDDFDYDSHEFTIGAPIKIS